MQLKASLPCSQEPATGPCFLVIHSNIIFLSIHRSSERSLPFRFSDQNTVCISHATWTANLILLDSRHPNIWWSVQAMKLIMQPSAISSLLVPNILLSTLFSIILNLCCSLVYKIKLQG